MEDYVYEEMKEIVSKLGSTERIRRLNVKSHGVKPTICLHRARAYTDVFKETEGEPISIRRAKALKKSVESLPINIGKDELIVGDRACRIKSVPVVPECHGAWLQWDLDQLPTRAQDSFEVPPDQMAEAKELLSYWKGKTVYDEWARKVPGEYADKLLSTGWGDLSCGLFFQGYHFTPPWEKILTEGIVSFENQIKDEYSKLDTADPKNKNKQQFLDGLSITVDAIKLFAERYVKLAREMAATETDETRKNELLTIAENCEHVPYYPARNFHEALQSVWMVHIVMYLEGTGVSYTVGRFDQYMYPYYKADLENGKLTRESALELIENYFINLNNNLFLYDTQSTYNSAGYTQYQTMSLAGVDEYGKDASNDLTYLCLDASISVRTVQPDIVLLCHPRETPYELKLKGAELVKTGLGFPKFHNTETIKTELMDLGYTRTEASMGWVRGCSELYGPGSKQYGHTAGTFVNLGLSLEAALFDGIKQVADQKWSGKQIGLKTGDATEFKNFEEVYEAVKNQIAYQIEEAHIGGSYMELAQEGCPQMIQSLFTDDCIGRGLPANFGGAKINVGPGLAITGGWATVADSLAVIKKLVFEEKKLTMAQMLEALRTNYEGHEDIRQMVINDAPKFGNDDDYVDDIARDLFHFVSEKGKSHIGIHGNRDTVGTAVSTAHLSFGTFVGATPDGRKASTPLSDNVGPMDHMDKSGPVAHINSVTKLGLDQECGTIHNIYFTNIDTEDKKRRMIDIIDAYHRRGGHHLQINCIDKNTLIDAQTHPEKYPALMVRVAGYVAYFTDLSKKVQDDIISRTNLAV